MWCQGHKLTRLARSVRPPLTQCWMWCRSTRRDSQPGNRHRQPSRSRAARRIAALGRRRRRPRASTAPPSPWVIQDSAAPQPSSCAVEMLTAGPSSTWHRPGSAGSPGTRGAGGVSAETSRPGPARSAQAARSALSSTAPASGGSRNVPDSEPSSSNRQASRRRTRASASSAAVTWRCARANRSSWFPVIGPAISASPASFAAVAIRVSARTLAYDSRAAANRARITGRSRSARATRTCSRAVPEDIWHFHDSHCAQLFISQLAQPRRASKSPSRTRNRHVAAARCPASSQICASSRSSGTPAGSAGDAAASAGGETAAKIEPGLSISNMYSTLAGRYVKTGRSDRGRLRG